MGGMTRAEMLLKVVMSPLDPSIVFVEQYVRLVQDTDSTELSKLLDMKGVKRSDQTQFVNLYKEQHSKLQSEMAGAGGHGMASGVASLPGSPAHSGGDQSRIAKLEKMIKNRL